MQFENLEVMYFEYILDILLNVNFEVYGNLCNKDLLFRIYLVLIGKVLILYLFDV